MTIGTAKPTSKEQTQAIHHFVDSHHIQEQFSTGQFEKQALLKIHDLFQHKKIVLMTGGSGLYIRAVCEGLDQMPTIKPDLRNELNEALDKKGLHVLQEKLHALDYEYYQTVDLHNPQRVIRALEVCLTTGKPYSYFRSKKPKKRPFRILKIGLHRERDDLYQRINLRSELMLKQGLFEEVKTLYVHKHLNALRTVGYTEFFDFIDHRHTWEEAIRLFKRNTRRYAKRQLTWFRKDQNITWFHPYEITKIINFIESNTN